MRAASSPAASSDARTATASVLHAAGDFDAVYARHMAVRKAGEERHIGEDGRPHAALATGERRFEGREADTEHVVVARDVLARDHVASRPLPASLRARRTFGVSRTSCVSADPRPPGEASTIASNTAAVSSMSIPSRTFAEIFTEIAVRHLGGAEQGGAEQDDAEIGVGPDRQACRADRFEDAPPDRQAGIGERGGGDAWRW